MFEQVTGAEKKAGPVAGGMLLSSIPVTNPGVQIRTLLRWKTLPKVSDSVAEGCGGGFPPP